MNNYGMMSGNCLTTSTGTRSPSSKTYGRPWSGIRKSRSPDLTGPFVQPVRCLLHSFFRKRKQLFRPLFFLCGRIAKRSFPYRYKKRSVAPLVRRGKMDIFQRFPGYAEPHFPAASEIGFSIFIMHKGEQVLSGDLSFCIHNNPGSRSPADPMGVKSGI